MDFLLQSCKSETIPRGGFLFMDIQQSCGSKKGECSRASVEIPGDFTPNSFSLQKEGCNMVPDSFHEVPPAVSLTAHRTDTDVGK